VLIIGRFDFTIWGISEGNLPDFLENGEEQCGSREDWN